MQAPVTYTGTTTVYGVLNLAGAAKLASNAPLIIRGQLIIFNDSVPQPDRVPDAKPVILKAGWIDSFGNAQGAPGGEVLGTVTSANGRNRITVFQTTNNPGWVAGLTINNLVRNIGTVVDFNSVGGPLVSDPHLYINSQAPTNFMPGGYTSYSDSLTNVDFVKYTAALGVAPLAASDYFAGDPSAWTASTIAQPASTGTLTSSKSVYAVKVTDLNLGAFTLNVVSGAMIHTIGTIQGSAGNRMTAGGSVPSEFFSPRRQHLLHFRQYY